MYTKKIIDIICESGNYNEEQKEIIRELENARQEWENARICFQFVNDNKLIDLMICREDEAKSKYLYFLSLAKRQKITLDASLMLENLYENGK